MFRYLMILPILMATTSVFAEKKYCDEGSATSSILEMESGKLRGAAFIQTDLDASNGESVQLGLDYDSVTLKASRCARYVLLAYRSDSSGTLNLKINNRSAGKFNVEPTAGKYAFATIKAKTCAHDKVRVSLGSNNLSVSVDYLEFVNDPLRSISTFINFGHGSSDGLSLSDEGDLYVSGGPYPANILKVTPAGDLTEFASGFSSVNGSDFDSAGNLYVAAYRDNAVFKVAPDGSKTVFASALDGPAGVYVDKNDEVYVSLFGANFSGMGSAVMKISPSGEVTTYASGGGLADVIGVTGDKSGRIYASNWNSGVLYEVTNGEVKVFAETGARANQICSYGKSIYVPSPSGNFVSKINRHGTVKIIAGPGAEGPLGAASFSRPNSCELANDGSVLFVVNANTGEIFKIDAGTP